MTALSLQTLHALGWTLLHFVWQGAALAALFAALLMMTRNANVRYALGIGTLMLMLAAPVVTFAWLDRAPSVTLETLVVPATPGAISASEIVSSPGPLVHALAAGANQQDMMLWLVQAWFVGVMLLSVRTAGGFLWLARTRRGAIEPLSDELFRQCLELQRRMGLQRRIRFGQCRWLDSPVVLGWFRPIVLVTTQAVTGLSPQQLQAIIAHELAHIRRYDAFVNLFQIVTEMLLFYHPAMWWVSRRIRIEREVCCDRAALAACGELVSYARALTLMEEWRAAPSLVMAANRSPLAERVLRLMGMHGASARSRVAGISASILGIAVAVSAGFVFVAAAQTTSDREERIVAPASPAPAAAPASESAPPAPAAAPMSKPVLPAPAAASVSQPASPAEPAAAPASKPAPAPQSPRPPQATPAPAPAAPPRPPEATRSEHIGTRSEIDETTAAKPYVESVKATGLRNVSVDELIGMKVLGITPAYIEAMLATKLNPEVDHLIAMKVHDVTPEYIDEVRQVVADLDVEDIIAMKVHDVTPQFIREMQAAGIDIRVADELIAARVHDITPALVKKALEHGFQDLTIEKLMMLQNIDVI